MGPPGDLVFVGPRVSWFQVTTFMELLKLRNNFPHTTQKGKPQHPLVMGNTEIGWLLNGWLLYVHNVHIILGVEIKLRNALYDVLIYPRDVPELNVLELTEKGLTVGGAVTLSELNKKLQKLVSSMPGTTLILFNVRT